MNWIKIALVSMVSFVSGSAWAVAFAPDTTLVAETSNNTSASNAFTGRYFEWVRNADNTTSQTGTILNNGALVPTNISKVPISELYPSSTAKYWVTSQSWFTTSAANVNAATGKLKDGAVSGSHLDIGYSNADSAQGQRQIDDMISRGFDGLIVNWQSSAETVTTQFLNNVVPYAASKGFKIIVEEDMGALNFHCNTATQSYEDCVVRDITFIINNWADPSAAGSSAYYRIGTRPVIMLFSLETVDPSLNWTNIVGRIPGNPMLVWQGSGGFSKQFSSGSYMWLDATGFYSAAKTAQAATPPKHPWGSAYKGFDDRIASWTKPKVIAQSCGQNWLNTWAAARSAFPAGDLENMHVVTWDDYQEGSELETGIDNCLGSVNLSVAGGQATWSLTFNNASGTESTIHHYTVYAAQDGQNLMTLQDGVTSKTVNLDAYQLPSGTYQIFVKAVGQPSMKNVMSKGQSYVSAGGAGPSANITKPVGGATVPSPIEFVAQALNDTPTHWALYDGNSQVLSFDSNSTSFDQTVPLAAGQHTVTIQFWDPSGAVFKDAVAITVPPNSPPVASIAVSPTSGVAPVTVSATVSGTDGDGTIVSASIDWGDGSADTAASTGSHTYAAGGSYVVTGTVTDNNGASDTATATVTVTSPTQPLSITLTSPTDGQQISGMVPVKACAQSSNPITNFTIYFNGTAHKSIRDVSCIDTTINPGCFSNANVTVNVWDSSSAVTKDSAAPVNIVRAVTVDSPADLATVTTSVHVVSTACSSMATVTTSKIYLDGVEAFSTSGAHIDHVVPVSAHKTHWLRMQSWDATGVSFWDDIHVTVP